MKKRTIVARLQEKHQEELKRADLELVAGGRPTITQDRNGTLIVVEDHDY